VTTHDGLTETQNYRHLCLLESAFARVLSLSLLDISIALAAKSGVGCSPQHKAA
jgi:hypothetical protein